MTVYIVTDSNECVEAFLLKTSARNAAILGLKNHAAEWGFSDEELIESIKDLDGCFAAGKAECSTYLGEYTVTCTETSLVED